MEKRQGCHAVVNGKPVVIFSSNDYLGLSTHPKVLEAAKDAAANFGVGTGGAPGTTGTTIIHARLKEAIATFKSRQKAVLFPSGYQANQAIHQSLGNEDRVFYIDKRHHPSAYDGVRLAKSSDVVRFDHNRLDELETALSKNQGKLNIVTLPSVFTVDGDIAPLDKLAIMKAEFRFVLILDEAHATGCIGKNGHGIEEHFGLQGTADFIMGTFSKALGSQGGFLTFNNGSEKYLVSGFRASEYSTSLSAISAAAALKAIELIEKNNMLVATLHNNKQNIEREFRSHGNPLVAGESMIMLLPCHNPEGLQGNLLEKGYLTVPVDALIDSTKAPSLRITPMAIHQMDDITGFVSAIRDSLSSI